MIIGARTIKTGLAVALTVFLVNILEMKLDVETSNFAAMAAIMAIVGMRPSIKSSLDNFKNRVIATIIGSLVAIILALTLGLNALYLGLGSIAIILICLKLGLTESISFALITLVAVGTYYDFSIMQIAYRVSGMLIGLTVSTGLNIIFMPPDYTQDLKAKINDLRIKFENLFEDAANDILREEKIEKEVIKYNRQIIRDELDDTRDVYALLAEDVLPKNKKMIKHYRRSINAIQSNLERLTAMHISIVYMSSSSQYSKIRQNLYKYLEYLLLLHRQIYNHIALSTDYQQVENDIDTEEIRKEIVELIKVDDDESVFEFYNVYFEATRINEKLDQLICEFKLEEDRRDGK
ncbi:MAG: aromatic acid exporter family protein [Syntrophaceticus sp.]|nr:aromatic acid exporter family protein [Syntrophaceticus sp.]